MLFPKFVKDQCIGIPIDEQQYLYKRFFCVRNVEHIQGTGLSLSIEVRYLGLIGGDMEFTSTLCEGSTFSITLEGNE